MVTVGSIVGALTIAAITGTFATSTWFAADRLVAGSLASALFVSGWALQIYGHRREGNSPSVLGDARYLLIGLLWWCAQVVGLRPWRGTSNTQSTLTVADRVFNAQVEQLYRLAPQSLVFSLVAAALVYWLLFGAIPEERLLVWMLFAVLLNVGRLIMVRAHSQDRDAVLHTELWARRFWIGSLLNGCVWGLCGSLLMPRGHASLQFALVALLGVIPGISFSSLAAICAVFMAFVLPFVTPVAISLLFGNGSSETVIGVAAIVFLFVLWAVGRRGEQDIIKTFTQRFENDDLMVAIREAQRRAEHASQELAAEVAKRESAQAQLLLAKDTAENANQAKSMFLATMSHEIRTPMNGIIGMAELMQRTPLTPKQQHYLSTIERSGQALLVIINDILDFSKIEAGKVELEDIVFEPRRIVRDVHDLFAETAANKGLMFTCAVDENIPIALRGDPTRLRQILLNLVSNAVKFTSVGFITLRVSPLETSTPERCRFTVRVQDTGIGMDDQAIQRLFRPFSQADSTTTREFGGTGLGLAISRHLVELMGGSIVVESTAGTGTCFTLLIELAAVADATLQPTYTSTFAPQFRRGSVVLLVEDNEVNRLVATAMLEELGCGVQIAETGAAAVAFLASHTPDLVLMDCQMPVMDGFEATRRIRKARNAIFGSKHRLPIIALTANAAAGDRENCLAAGMDDYLTKPFSQGILLETLVRWLPVSTQPALPALTAHG